MEIFQLQMDPIHACSDNMTRLATDSDVYNILEVCYNGAWHRVCADEEWNDEDAQVVCKNKSNSLYYKGKWLFLIFLHSYSENLPIQMPWLCIPIIQ